MPRKSTPPEIIAHIRELYGKGVRRWEIRKKLGVSNWLIQYYTKDMPRQVRRLTIEEKEVKRLHEKGCTLSSIAKQFNIHKQTVYNITRNEEEVDINRRYVRGLSLAILSELVEKGYMIIPQKNQNYTTRIKKLMEYFDIRKVGFYRGINSISICFLPYKKGEALKEILKLMKKRTTSYQELNILSQAFGLRLGAEEKRKNVSCVIKDAF